MAFLLFLANFAAITLGAMVVFLLGGRRAPRAARARGTAALPARAIAVLLFVVLAVPASAEVRTP